MGDLMERPFVAISINPYSWIEILNYYYAKSSSVLTNMRYIAYQRRGSEVESKLSFLEKIKNSDWKYENLDSNLDGETPFFFSQ